jgi:hypothetical protein
MSGQMQQAEIVCQLCGKKVQVRFQNQKMKYCGKCSKKLKAVGSKVEAEVDKQRIQAKKKAAKKPKVIHLHCEKCEKTFRCPICSPAPKKVTKKVSKPKSKKTSATAKKGGKKNVKS